MLKASHVPLLGLAQWTKAVLVLVLVLAVVVVVVGLVLLLLLPLLLLLLVLLVLLQPSKWPDLFAPALVCLAPPRQLAGAP